MSEAYLELYQASTMGLYWEYIYRLKSRKKASSEMSMCFWILPTVEDILDVLAHGSSEKRSQKLFGKFQGSSYIHLMHNVEKRSNKY